MKKLFYILSLLFLFACSGSQTKPSMYLTQGPRTTMERIVDTFEMRLVDKAGISAIVLTFTDISGKVHPDGDLLAEKLSTELAKREKITILDRLVFQKKLEENSLDLKGGADLNKIKKIGKVLEVDYVVIGLMSSYAGGYDINCRLVDTKTGHTLSAEESFYQLDTTSPQGF